MKAYKFETTVLEGGIIKIPELNNLANHKIELFIVEKDDIEESRDFDTYEQFSDKWKGLLKGIDIDNWKDDYIEYKKEKYK